MEARVWRCAGVSRRWRAVHDAACTKLWVYDGVTDEAMHVLGGRLPVLGCLCMYKVKSLTVEGLRELRSWYDTSREALARKKLLSLFTEALCTFTAAYLTHVARVVRQEAACTRPYLQSGGLVSRQ